MTRLTPRAALAISLCAIAAAWAWQLATVEPAQVLPEQFSALVLRIARNKVLVFACLFLLLRLGGETFAALGVRREGWAKQIGLGTAIGLGMFVAFNVFFTALMESMIPPPAKPAGPSVMRFFADPTHLFAWLPIGIFGGGVVEELERIFIVTRFEKWLGRPGLVLGVVASSAMFGVGHLYQGLGVAISTAVSGAVFALVYLRRRSALEPIAAHAASDVFAMLAATFLHH